jgi:hypothetical protein
MCLTRASSNRGASRYEDDHDDAESAHRALLDISLLELHSFSSTSLERRRTLVYPNDVPGRIS